MSGADGNGGSSGKYVTSGTAEELKALAEAGDGATSSMSKFGTELAKLVDADAKAKAATEQYVESLKQQKKAQEEATEKTSKAIGEAAEMASKFGGELQKAGEVISATNPELGNLIGNFGGVTKEVGNAVSATVAGFASGGPVVGALSGVTAIVQSYASAWIEAKKAENDAALEAEKTHSDIAAGYREINRARGEKQGHAFIESINEEVEAMKRANDSLSINTRLMHERKTAQAEIDSSEVALRLAQIEADPNMSATDKIRARAEEQKKLVEIRSRRETEELDNQEAQARDELANKKTAQGGVQLKLDQNETHLAGLKREVGLGPKSDASQTEWNSYYNKMADIEIVGKESEALKGQMKQATADVKKAEQDLATFQQISAIRKKAINITAGNENSAAAITTEAKVRDLSGAENERRNRALDGAQDAAKFLSSDKKLTAQQRAQAEEVSRRLQKGQAGANDLALLERILDLSISQSQNDSKRVSQLKQLEQKVESLERSFKGDRGRSGR